MAAFKYGEQKYGTGHLYGGPIAPGARIGEVELKIGEVEVVLMEDLRRSFRRRNVEVEVPRGHSVGHSDGVALPVFEYRSAFHAETDAEAKRIRRQLVEVAQNPDLGFVFIDFDKDDRELNGWFLVDDLSVSELPGVAGYYPFTLTLRRVAAPGNCRLATCWTHDAEACAWTLTGQKLVTLPYGVTSPLPGATAERTTDEGAVKILVDPTPDTIPFVASADVADRYKGQCRVFDTVTPGDATEADWERVYDGSHDFSGDVVLQNGLLRWKLDVANEGTHFYVYDPTGTQWREVGQLRITLTGGLTTLVRHLEITKLTAEEIEWEELRQSDDNAARLICSLRRGAFHVRVRLETDAVGIGTGTFIHLHSGSGGNSWFRILYNTQDVSDQALDAEDDVAQDSAYNFSVAGTDLPAGRYAVAARVKTSAGFQVIYELRIGAYAGGAWKPGYCDYAPYQVGPNWTYPKWTDAGVALCYYDHDGLSDFAVRAEKITSQAYDWRIDYLLLLPIYSTATRSFPQDVGLQCLERVEQQLVPVPKGYYDG